MLAITSFEFYLFYLFIYFAHQTLLNIDRKKTNIYIYIYIIKRQSLMAWQHMDVGITPTNANSVQKHDPIGIDYKRPYKGMKIISKCN